MGDMTEIVLETERRVRMSTLNQFRTYEGVMEGLPTKRHNRFFIEKAVEKVRSWAGNEEPYLIEPTQMRRSLAGRDYFVLPAVTCAAEFLSHGHDASSRTWLWIIWYQEEFALPIDEEVVAQIQRVPWDSVASRHFYG